MPPLIVPDSLKSFAPYFKKAEELNNDETNPDSKVVGFTCRSHAMNKAIKMKDIMNQIEARDFLLSQMTILEKEKTSMTLSLSDRKLICEKFAFRVFALADDEDRAGRASKETARTFNAAATFFDVLEEFGELASDVQEKKRYAKFKTIDILKAIKEGRQPAIGAPGEELPNENPTIQSFISVPEPVVSNIADIAVTHTDSNPSSSNNNTTIFDIPEAPTERPLIMPTPPFAAPPPISPPQVPYTSPVIINKAPSFIPMRSFGSNLSSNAVPPQRTKDAIELCNFAVAAMKVS